MFEMLATVIPATQMQPGGDLGGHLAQTPRQRGDDHIKDMRAAGRETLLQNGELHRDIPLHGHLIVRDRDQQPAPRSAIIARS